MKLNILCCNPNGGAFLYITRGWENAFKALGHNFLRWDGSAEQLRGFKPHLYLGCSGWRQNFPDWAKRQFGTKIAIHVNPWGTTKIARRKGEPDINEPQGTIRWVEAQKPDFLYCYALDDDISHLWNHWKDKIAPVLAMPNAGDAVIYHPVDPLAQYACEVGFVGGRWPYKSLNIDKYLIPVLEKTRAQVYGWGGWGRNPKYKGNIKDKDVNKIFSSAKICPSIVEPHTSRVGIDIPERMFKVPLGGGFTILDPCKGLERYVSKAVFPIATDPKTYHDLITYYLKNGEKREKLRKEQQKAILKDHTYFTRIQGFLRLSGHEDEAQKAQEKVEELFNALV